MADQAQFVNPLTDISRFSVIASRWSPAHDTCEGMLKDAGCNVRVYTWLTEDEDSPHPELAALIGQEAARPSRNCLVIAVEDNSGVVGLTGTAVDGAVNLVATTADDLLAEILYQFNDADAIDPRTNQNVKPYIRDLLGTAPKLPSIVFRDSTAQSPIKSSEHATFKSKAKSIIVGGKSPGWVNELQTFGIKFGLSYLQLTHVYGGAAGAAAWSAQLRRAPASKRYIKASSTTCSWRSCGRPIRCGKSKPETWGTSNTSPRRAAGPPTPSRRR